MEGEGKQSLFQVYLRLRPPHHTAASKGAQDPWLLVETPTDAPEEGKESLPTHITLQPPNDSRKRAVEKFGFTQVFEENASQLDVFDGAGSAQIVESVLKNGRDGLVATLGVTGSGKSHTILGDKSQRGLTQMSLDMIFQSIDSKIRGVSQAGLSTNHNLLASLQASDPSEATLSSAATFLDSIYGDSERGRYSRAQTPMAGGFSRAQTPMTVRNPNTLLPGSFPVSSPEDNVRPSALYSGAKSLARHLQDRMSPAQLKQTVRVVDCDDISTASSPVPPSKRPFWNRSSFVRKPQETKTNTVKEPFPTSTRRPPMPRVSLLPQSPSVTQYAVELNSDADYAVIVSMYEVYNDRIFDLLSLSMSPNGAASTTRAGNQLQKDLRRRPLLFKSTELSPDRKVVAGLRKVVCGSYEEAMLVLETGLTERRVAGTGSNSVSSRSHGFFCIEVKKNLTPRRWDGGHWTGGTLSIVDLAGSERARSAKTTGSTLAEAGKINESLMYLGQCLQLQSDYHHDKPAIVPYRQCKLTELLFSNSFPTSSAQQSSYRPQKATMIVTADPQGDFNATSQILRYSALAREVTVPRIPSVTSQILSSTATTQKTSNGGTSSGRTSPVITTAELDLAVSELARLSDENDVLTIRTAEQEIRITELTLSLQAAEEKALAVESEVRDECWTEMEIRIEEERLRWRAAWEEEKLKGEEFLDGKINILERHGGIAIAEDQTATQGDEELERENATLRAKIEALERELQGRSPTKKANSSKPLAASKSNLLSSTTPFKHKSSSSSTDMSILKLGVQDLKLDEMRETINHEKSVPKTPATVKKQRKLTTRKWDLAPDDSVVFD